MEGEPSGREFEGDDVAFNPSQGQLFVIECRQLARDSQLTAKVETSEAKEMINPVRFSQEYINRVANSKDILQYYRKKKVTEKSELGTLRCSRNRHKS